MVDLSVTVRCIPSSPRWIDSFYIGNLIKGLQEQGIIFDLPADESGDFLSARWLRNNTHSVDLLHFHWTHYHYTADSWVKTVWELSKFIGKIVLARQLGYRIVWTMHNYLPHERTYPFLYYIERFLLARLAHRVIVHCEYGRSLLRWKLLRRRDVSVIPLGDFSPSRGDQLSRESARVQLDLANELTVFLHFGLIRPYKQVPRLIREFQTLADQNLRLVIVGVSPYEILTSEIQELAQQDSRVLLRLEYLSDEQLGVYLRAADLAVFPYRDILGSGSVMLALSAGLPVVAPRAGCLAELITPACGMLYEQGPGAIAGAIKKCLDVNLVEMGQKAQARAGQFPWKTMVEEIAQVYPMTVKRLVQSDTR